MQNEHNCTSYSFITNALRFSNRSSLLAVAVKDCPPTVGLQVAGSDVDVAEQRRKIVPNNDL